MLRTVVIISFALCLFRVYGWEDNNFNGITQVALVVHNLEEATRFYTDLGGMLVPKLSTDGIWGDSHYYRLFQTQLIDILKSDNQKSTQTEGVVDIKDNGQWKLRWNMIMFGNFMLQLMQYVRRNNPEIAWTVFHPDGNGAAKVTLEHIAMWGQENMNLKLLAQQLRTMAGPGSTYGKKFVFNSVNTVLDREKQYNEPIDSLLQLGGELLVSDGTQSERLELSTTIGSKRKENHYKVFCQNKSPSPMLLDNWKSNRQNVKSWFGLHHVGVVVDKWNEANKFYTEVMGGKQAFGGSFPPGVGELQDDILDAFNASKTNSFWGFPYKSDAKQEINFMAFENAYLETNFFYTGNNVSVGEIDEYRWESLSPAYTRTIIAGFGVKPSKDLNRVVRDIETRSATKGMSQVKANRAVSVTSADQMVALEDYSKPLTEGDLQGYNYVLLRGPSQEPLFIVSYKDKALAALKEAMIEYQAKSGMFTETNPWKQDGFESDYCCSKFNVCGSTGGFTKTVASIIAVVVALSCSFVLKV